MATVGVSVVEARREQATALERPAADRDPERRVARHAVGGADAGEPLGGQQLDDPRGKRGIVVVELDRQGIRALAQPGEVVVELDDDPAPRSRGLEDAVPELEAAIGHVEVRDAGLHEAAVEPDPGRHDQSTSRPSIARSGP